MRKLILFCALLTGLALSSCNNDVCENNLCGIHEKCEDGACVPSDLVVARAAFTGIWNVSETYNGGTDAFSSSIAKHPTEDNMLLLYDLSSDYINIYAVMESSNSFEIPLQMTGRSTSFSGSAIAVSGSGILINSNTVSLNYTLESLNGAFVQNCTATYTK